MHIRGENAYKILVGKPEAKRPLRIHRDRWQDNIETDFRETRSEDVDWINLIQVRDRCRLLRTR
jgi:hypothetical protein